MRKFAGYLLTALCGCAITYLLIKILNGADARIQKKEREIEKYKFNYFLCSSWIDVKARGEKIADYLRCHNMNTIAVYGMGDIGVKLCRELQGTDIHIKYVIDRNIPADTVFAPMKKPDESLPQVDAIIVTPVNVFPQIKESLSAVTDNRIVSIEDIIYNI